MTSYRLSVADTRTGRVVGDVPFIGVPTWARTLNGAGALAGITVPLSPPLDADTWQFLQEPWRWTLIWSDGDAIRQAGILTGVTVDDAVQPATAAVTTMTVWEFLNRKRTVRNLGVDITTPAADVLFGATSPDPANQALSLHSIARRLVEMATTYDATYHLPLILPAAIAGTSERAYLAADLACTGVRLAELTQVIDGPEVEFSPEWSDSTQAYFVWRMRIGNNRLGQLGFPHTWDHGRALLSFPPVYDGVDMSFDTIAKGSDNRSTQGTPPVTTGELLWAQSTDTFYTDQGWPALDAADTSHTSVIDQGTIQAIADGDVVTHKLPVKTAIAVVRIDGLDNQCRQTGSPALDQVSPGDTGFFAVTNHPWLAQGQYGVRILSIANGPDAYSAALTVQQL